MPVRAATPETVTEPVRKHGNYLVLGSFRSRDKAQRTAAMYRQLGAFVMPARVNGEDWFRVTVEDRGNTRSRVKSAGIRDFWTLRM